MKRQPQTVAVISPKAECLSELIAWCKKWGPFTSEALFRSIEIHAAMNDVLTIKAEVYGIGIQKQ